LGYGPDALHDHDAKGTENDRQTSANQAFPQTAHFHAPSIFPKRFLAFNFQNNTRLK
jgi:hypothetical protein